MLFQAAWQIGMALVTPHSNPCSASFSFTSFIKSPGNTHKPLSAACPHRFLSLLDVQVPSNPPINTLLISQQKPAVNLKIPFTIPGNFKIPFSTPVKRWLWAVWLCSTCDTAPGEQKWQQMSQEMPPSLPRVNLGSSYTVTTRGSYWHVKQSF